MSQSHLAEGGASFDLALRPKANTDKSCSSAAPYHHSRPWIRTGLARLPPELIHHACSRLCLCCYCNPMPYPLVENPSGLVQERRALDALSKTCRFLCAVSQPYLFHAFKGASPALKENFEHHNMLINLHLFRSLVKLPHIANQVRRLTLNSIKDELHFLRRLNGLWMLRLVATSAGGIGLESYLSFPCLHELQYGPFLDTKSIAGIEDARKDLRAILTAAPSLFHLRCHRLWHRFSLSPFVLLKLPACHITTLELYQCWLPHGTFIRFIANFPRLKFFRLEETMPSHLASPSREYPAYQRDGPQRLADGRDVVVALNPSNKTLEKLILDFQIDHQIKYYFGLLQPMRSFMTLRTMHLSQGAIGYFESMHEIRRKPLTELLPRSIEDLIITDFAQSYRKAVLDLAKQAAAVEYPNLKRVRLTTDGSWQGYMSGKSFLAFASGQDAPPEVNDGHGGYIDMNPYEPQFDDDDDAEEEEEEEEEDDDEVEDGDGEEDDSVSEDSGLVSWGGFAMMQRQEWVEFGRRCLSDSDFMSEIARHVEEDSTIYLMAAINPVPLRKKVRWLFSKANVKFECVGVRVENGPSAQGKPHIVHM